MRRTSSSWSIGVLMGNSWVREAAKYKVLPYGSPPIARCDGRPGMLQFCATIAGRTLPDLGCVQAAAPAAARPGSSTSGLTQSKGVTFVFVKLKDTITCLLTSSATAVAGAPLRENKPPVATLVP